MSITLNSPWFEYVEGGVKEYEGRCHWKKCLEYKPGDQLNIRHHTDPSIPPFAATIIEIKTYKTFQEALEILPMSKVLPRETGEYTVKEGVETIKSMSNSRRKRRLAFA